MPLITATQRQQMIKTLGGSAQTIIDKGGVDQATIYCLFYNHGELIDMASAQVIATAPTILVDRSDVYVGGSWIIKADDGKTIEANGTDYTATSRLQDDAGFVRYELTEA